MSPERMLVRPMLLRRFGCDPYWRPLESADNIRTCSLRALWYSASLRLTIPSEYQWSAFTPGAKYRKDAKDTAFQHLNSLIVAYKLRAFVSENGPDEDVRKWLESTPLEDP